MSTTISSTKITPEELYQMGDEGRGFELIDGQLKERSMSRESTRAASRLLTHIQNYFDSNDQGWVYGMDLGYQCFPADPGRVRFADVSVILVSTLPVDQYEDEGYSTTAPDLVVESISPNDNAYDVENKIEQWLEAGVKVVLKLHPNMKTVHVYRRNGTLEQFTQRDDLSIEDLMPGFNVPVTQLFRKPGEKAAS